MNRDEILRRIAIEEDRIRELREELAQRETAHTNLLSTLNSMAETSPAPSSPPTVRHAVQGSPRTNDEKVALFRSLFRGREDVYPLRWENPKTGRSGYSPACSREWHPDLCDKKRNAGTAKRGNCGECPNRAFLPFNDEAIIRHLKGLHVMGVYPMLEDDTCRFLAVDFDGKRWSDDVAAFRETADDMRIPVAIERSRSGDGAHAWIFFDAPVPAVLARRLGCHLITETMSRRHEIAMTSYDRLFPNQDLMPKGGLGNLIALPLQRVARQQGNTLFLDRDFEPLQDQWAFLATVARLPADMVCKITEEALKRGRVIAVRAEEDDGSRPWIRKTPPRASRMIAPGIPPRPVRAVLRQSLYIESKGLPSPILADLKRIATFQNPEFHMRQNLRLSTGLTPRVISCATEHPEHVELPRGCRDEASRTLRDSGYALEIDDQRGSGTVLDCRFLGELSAPQARAVQDFLKHEEGILVAPPGSGKTVMAIAIAASRNHNTLVLTHRKPLLDQWVAQVSAFLELDRKDIGRVGAGIRRPKGRFDIAMMQSLVRDDGVDDLVGSYGHVIIDECHHVPAVSFERLLATIPAKYLTGLTATPRRRDGLHPIAEMRIGDIRARIDGRSDVDETPFRQSVIARETEIVATKEADEAGIQSLYALLVMDRARNARIVEDVISALAEGRSPIVLTERLDHLDWLHHALKGFAKNIVVLHGGMKARGRKAGLEMLRTLPETEERLILATGRYIGEGFDDARLDTLFLALPVAWRGTLVQYAGRLHRSRAGKTEVRIYDYVDRKIPVFARMFEKRLRGYRAMGYECVNEDLTSASAENLLVEGATDQPDNPN